MTTKFFATMLIVGLAAGMSSSTNAAMFKPTGQSALTSGSIVFAQTPGMERRQDRRVARQDCRQANGVVGVDKRRCKQDARQQR